MAARGLGKGLDSLIPDTIGETKNKKEEKMEKDYRNFCHVQM